MTEMKDDIQKVSLNSLISEYPVKGRGNQTSDGNREHDSEAVKNGRGKKCMGDVLYAQTYHPYG